MNNNPIGVWDSGIGGLTVLKEIVKILPNESIVYFGDTAHLPYGTKSKQRIEKLAYYVGNFLIKKKVKVIVVACNTASSYAIELLRKKFKLPIIDVIEPVVKEAVKKGNRIGVIGTEGTIKSNSYKNFLCKYNNITVISKPCPLFVPIVEEGWFKFQPEITYKIVKIYLEIFKTKKIDTLILGCTHYPLLKPLIKKALNKNINILDSAKPTAYQLKNILYKHRLNCSVKNNPEYNYYVTDSVEKFVSLAYKFINKNSKFIPTYKNTEKVFMENV